MLIENTRGGYSFLKGIAPYSSGVAASAGFAVERARLAEPLAVAAGFDRIMSHLHTLHRPPQALCAIELRIPAPFTFSGFDGFNGEYVKQIEKWNLLVGGLNPVARTNVAPEIDPPHEPVLYAFSYTVPSRAVSRSFVLAGTGELPEGSLKPGEVVRGGDISGEAMREKARFVIGVLDDRLRGLGVSWAAVTAVDIYTIRDIPPAFVTAELLRAGYRNYGLTWQHTRPPISGIDYEMDARGCSREIVL
jgi:hypothetical protein